MQCAMKSPGCRYIREVVGGSKQQSVQPLLRCQQLIIREQGPVVAFNTGDTDFGIESQLATTQASAGRSSTI